jgi:hypothetical protein
MNDYDLQLANIIAESLLELKDRKRYHPILFHVVKILLEHRDLELSRDTKTNNKTG